MPVFLIMIFVVLFTLVAMVAVASSLQALQVSGSFKGLFGFRGNVLGFNDGIIDADGKSVQLQYHAGSKNNPSRLQLSWTGDFFANALLRHETAADRFGKNIGLNDEAQTYDPSFDSEVYIECEDQDFVRQCLISKDVKDQLKTLLQDFTTLEIKGSQCCLVKTPCPNVNIFTQDRLTAAAKTLVLFAAGIPRPQPGQTSSTPVTDQVRASSGFLSGAGVLTIIVGIGLLIWGLVGFAPIYPGKILVLALKLSLPLFLIFMFYVYSQVKGFSNALTVLTGAFFSSLIGLPLLLWGGLTVVNGAQDVSAPTKHATSVVSKYISHSKNSTSYNITVSGWDDNRSTYSFTVPSYEYNRINFADPCVITTRDGLFSFTWVSARKCGR
ncbi:MAG: hypothetical protein HQL17_06305 [Candidatus Omnitrophica bacterium]|nr:hypothetical protein [Candidatus Omnitrophota bacterium]